MIDELRKNFFYSLITHYLSLIYPPSLGIQLSGGGRIFNRKTGEDET